MSFQSQVNINPAPGSVGGIASMNPLATVDAGPGGLTAGPSGAFVGRFAWNTYATPGGPGTGQSSCPISASLAPRKPDGFICNRQQALITQWLGNSSLLVPTGTMLIEHALGDFWAYSNLAEASIGQKVFANLVDGQILAAAAGASPTNIAGTAAVISSATAASLTNYTLTINTVTSGIVAVGQLVTGAGILPGTYIESFGTFTVAGGNGTVFLSQNVRNTFTAQSIAAAPTEAYSYYVGTASFATSIMTVVSVTSGALVAGQIVTSASVAAGTYIVSQLTGTPGGIGTYQLSTTPGTITTQAASATAWIETDWYVKSAGNVMDLIKIGRP
jgi:hypothetical protein